MRERNRQRLGRKSPSSEQLHSLPAALRRTDDAKGFSLVEMLVALTIFSIVTAGAFSAFMSQIKHSTREYALAEADIELGIAKNILIRDLELGGYGIAENYADAVADPALPANILAFSGTEGTAGNPDILKLRGTALGMANRAAQGWSYVANEPSPTTFHSWGDAREDLQNNDAVILIEPTAKQLLVEGVAAKNWLFTYHGTPADLTPLPTTLPAVGTLVYGLGSPDAKQPFNTVRYYLGGTPPAGCAPGTDSLLRAESNETDTPASGDPLLACVRSFQVAFGLDTDENGTINDWDDGGVIASTYTAVQQRKRLKQIRVFILVQSGNRDTEMTLSPATIRVGDTLAGQDITLTAAQRQYRWRLVTVSVTPRNLR